MTRSYIAKTLEARFIAETGYFGIFAIEPIKQGDLLCLWGGPIWTADEFSRLPEENQSHGLQVDEGLFQTYGTDDVVESADYVNHCCTPNAGLQGPISLVAMRDIAVGEQVCFDYAMSDGSPYDEFVCQCGSADCRGTVTGNDWQLRALQLRYKGYFSPYLQRRIDQLTAPAVTQPSNNSTRLEPDY